MALGRRRRSLAGTAVRTAVITGTAAATANAVNARGQAAAAPPPAPVPPPPSPTAAPASPSATEDVLARLERLAALRASGALTEDEFTLLKARTITGGAP
ncbi:SHOCT domain-containing protein [Arthrobacter agilis]|jgi:hypothetical protein|uniref:SHOCT domain-containing protein n=1 Tax=Arthrobacter agilis TaxID=37921 RepID=UPI00278132EB|nr:SHOCT domain-containing protein [Arthrobacter agilis]MDQ0734896.1 hypothetical protein [Arthrobacter agilis]